MITTQQLLVGMPRCPDVLGWTAALNAAMLKFGISRDADYVCAFLAQVAHESAELTRLEENLNYKADRLLAVWPRRFPTLEVAQKYAGRPQALANYVYADRHGNRGETSGDGWRYRGRGPIMVTFEANYARLAKRIGDPLLVICPERAQTKTIGALLAAAYWVENPRLNLLADDLPDDDDIKDFDAISRIVNGGENGLIARRKYWATFRRALGLKVAA